MTGDEQRHIIRRYGSLEAICNLESDLVGQTGNSDTFNDTSLRNSRAKDYEWPELLKKQLGGDSSSSSKTSESEQNNSSASEEVSDDEDVPTGPLLSAILTAETKQRYWEEEAIWLKERRAILLRNSSRAIRRVPEKQKDIAEWDEVYNISRKEERMRANLHHKALRAIYNGEAGEAGEAPADPL